MWIFSCFSWYDDGEVVLPKATLIGLKVKVCFILLHVSYQLAMTSGNRQKEMLKAIDVIAAGYLH